MQLWTYAQNSASLYGQKSTQFGTLHQFSYLQLIHPLQSDSLIYIQQTPVFLFAALIYILLLQYDRLNHYQPM